MANTCDNYACNICGETEQPIINNLCVVHMDGPDACDFCENCCTVEGPFVDGFCAECRKEQDDLYASGTPMCGRCGRDDMALIDGFCPFCIEDQETEEQECEEELALMAEVINEDEIAPAGAN